MFSLFQKLVAIIESLITIVIPLASTTPSPSPIEIESTPKIEVSGNIDQSSIPTPIPVPRVSTTPSPSLSLTPTPTPTDTKATEAISELTKQLQELKEQIAQYTPEPTPTPFVIEVVYRTPTPTPSPIKPPEIDCEWNNSHRDGKIFHFFSVKDYDKTTGPDPSEYKWNVSGWNPSERQSEGVRFSFWVDMNDDSKYTVRLSSGKHEVSCTGPDKLFPVPPKVNAQLVKTDDNSYALKFELSGGNQHAYLEKLSFYISFPDGIIENEDFGGSPPPKNYSVVLGGYYRTNYYDSSNSTLSFDLPANKQIFLYKDKSNELSIYTNPRQKIEISDLKYHLRTSLSNITITNE